MADYSLMYKSIKGGALATDISQLGRFKMAIVGKPKAGKSWLACTMPGEKYIFDFDSRKESVAGKPQTFVKTYKDVDYTVPSAALEVETDLTSFEYAKKKGEPIPDVFIFDSATHWVKAAENQFMKTGSNLKREVKFGSKEVLIPKGWDIITGVRNYMENIITRAADLGHVIVVFHEEPEKDKIRSKPEEPVYTGQYAVHPFYLRTLLSTFNEVWRLEVTPSGEYSVTTKPTHQFGASTTLHIDVKEKADIPAILAKHQAAVAKKA